MRPATFWATTMLACWCVLAAVAGAQQPTFRSSVDVTTVDVIVIDSRGRPITDLSAGDFRVRVDGHERRVVSARWVPQTGAGRQASAPEVVPGYTTNEGSIDGRLFIMAVDQPNLRFASLASM